MNRRDRDDLNGGLNRRQFLVLAAAAVTSSKVGVARSAHDSSSDRVIDAGPISKYNAAGVYADFRDLGFFLVRKGLKVIAFSAYCTHRKCKLSAERDLSFYCKCHGSTFDPSGKVTEGPATRDLPMLPTSTDEREHLLVRVPAS
jgi:nitrite reductase/ring-hydroxylating ferredoxin subunit